MLLVRVVNRFSRFEIYGFARIIRRSIESEQESSIAFGQHVITMADTFGNNDEISSDGSNRICAGDYDDVAFEHIKFVIGVRMKMQPAAAGYFDVIHSRFRRR